MVIKKVCFIASPQTHQENYNNQSHEQVSHAKITYSFFSSIILYYLLPIYIHHSFFNIPAYKHSYSLISTSHLELLIHQNIAMQSIMD